MINIHQPKNSNKSTSVFLLGGFTLVETLVAISILLIAVVGPMSAISRSLIQMTIARDQMIAINLAQEGIEAVRQKRDSNVLEEITRTSPPPVDWMKNLNTGGYTIDTGFGAGPVLNGCGGACAPQPVPVDSVTGLYRQGAGTVATPFSRVVTIRHLGPGSYQRQIISKVTWVRGGKTWGVEVSEVLFEWAG